MGALLLSGCALVPRTSPTVVTIECLKVPEPPAKVLDAIEPLIGSEEVDDWLVAYDRALRKQDACRS